MTGRVGRERAGPDKAETPSRVDASEQHMRSTDKRKMGCGMSSDCIPSARHAEAELRPRGPIKLYKPGPDFDVDRFAPHHVFALDVAPDGKSKEEGHSSKGYEQWPGKSAHLKQF